MLSKNRTNRRPSLGAILFTLGALLLSHPLTAVAETPIKIEKIEPATEGQQVTISISAEREDGSIDTSEKRRLAVIVASRLGGEKTIRALMREGKASATYTTEKAGVHLIVVRDGKKTLASGAFSVNPSLLSPELKAGVKP